MSETKKKEKGATTYEAELKLAGYGDATGLDWTDKQTSASDYPDGFEVELSDGTTIKRADLDDA